jgi:hypothetical protein
MTTIDNVFTQKKPNKFYCEICDFKCSYNRDYQRHLQTIKHKNNVSTTIDNKKLVKKYICENCDKKYNDRAGLWRHKQKCEYNDLSTNKSQSNNLSITPELIVELIKNNTDMQQTIMSLNNTIQGLVSNGITNMNNNHINSHNKSFNLQFFLNETCKNAMNIMDFANSIQLKLTDLENVGELGYVEGISKIIIDNLKLLDVTERPVHCSDFKRDVMYVKDEDKWEKENENNSKIKKLIHSVTNKNISLIPEWKQKYPDCTNINSNKSTKINKMIMEVMETDKTKDEKIIKKIAKETTIDKEPI